MSSRRAPGGSKSAHRPNKQPPRRTKKTNAQQRMDTRGAAGGPGGNVGTFSGKTVAEAKAACCANPKCKSDARRFLDCDAQPQSLSPETVALRRRL